MDSPSQTRSQQSPSPSFHQTFPPSGEYSPKALGVTTSSMNHLAQSGSYTAYSPTNSPPVLSPLASPVVELDGMASASPFGYSIAAQQAAMDRQSSYELGSTNSVRVSERVRQSVSPQLRPACPSSPSPTSSYDRAPPPPPPGGWVNR